MIYFLYTILFLLLVILVLSLYCGNKVQSNSKITQPSTTPTAPPVTPTAPPVTPPVTPTAPPVTPVVSAQLSIESQQADTIQIVNNTSEDPLHVFLQLNNMGKMWVKLGGTVNTQVFRPVDWSIAGYAWDPLGAKIACEAIIPLGGYIVLKYPDLKPAQFIAMAIKMTKSTSTPLVLADGLDRCGGTICKVLKQSSILLEGGKDVVADTSAVDGINFRLTYQLTTSSGIKSMSINKNPCGRLDSRYLNAGGCMNPAKKDCDGPTCVCKENQVCKFNSCSSRLFNIPDRLKSYVDNYDSGNPNAVVKAFINNKDNLKADSSLKNFCDDLQYKTGDFTTYCYDYNDVGSSEYLRSPYKIKLIYLDL